MLFTGIVVGSLALAFERRVPLVLDLHSLGALLYLAVMGSSVSFTVYYWTLAHAPATRVAMIAYTIPIVAVVVGAVAFGKPLRLRLLLAGAFVLAGVAWVNRARHPPKA